MTQTIRERVIVSRRAENSPRVLRATYHREAKWLDGPYPDYSAGDRFVGWMLAVIACGAFVLLLAGLQ